jgi:hypothetical protein
VLFIGWCHNTQSGIKLWQDSFIDIVKYTSRST